MDKFTYGEYEASRVKKSDHPYSGTDYRAMFPNNPIHKQPVFSEELLAACKAYEDHQNTMHNSFDRYTDKNIARTEGHAARITKAARIQYRESQK